MTHLNKSFLVANLLEAVPDLNLAKLLWFSTSLKRCLPLFSEGLLNEEGQVLLSLSDCLPSKIFFLLSAMRRKELAKVHGLDLCLNGFSKGCPAGYFNHHSGSYSRWGKNGLAVNCTHIFLKCLTYEPRTS